MERKRGRAETERLQFRRVTTSNEIYRFRRAKTVPPRLRVGETVNKCSR